MRHIYLVKHQVTGEDSLRRAVERATQLSVGAGELDERDDKIVYMGRGLRSKRVTEETSADAREVVV